MDEQIQQPEDDGRDPGDLQGLEAVQALLRAELAGQGENSGDGDNTEDDQGEIQTDDLGLKADDGDREDQPPADLQSLAERSGLTLEQLYAMPVGIGGGEGQTTTLGALKDGFQGVQQLEEERNAWTTQRTDSENELLRARNELAVVMRMLPELPAELLNRASAEISETIAREQQSLFEIKPEWRDPGVYAAAETQMISFAERYGFSAGEFKQAHDHRLKKLVYDFAQLQARVDSANANRKRQVPTGVQSRAAARATPSRTAGADSAVRAAKENPTTENQVSAVMRLLNEG